MEKYVAVYLDFENLAISAESAFSDQTQPLLLEPIVEYAAQKGHISLKFAYADWSKDIFAQYQSNLIELGFELIHLPGTNLQGKNGADVRLAIDVIEHLDKYPMIQTVVIGSGDSDFIPLIQRVQSRNRQVVVIGFEHSVAQLIKKNIAEFRSLETILRDAQGKFFSEDESAKLQYARELLLRYIHHHEIKEPVLMARLKQQLMKMDPTFSEKTFGFSSFKQFLLAFEGDLVAKIDHAQSTLPFVHLLAPKNGQPQASNIKATAGNFLTKKIRFRTEQAQRMRIAEALVEIFGEEDTCSMNEMFDYIHALDDITLSKADIRKYINTLFTGGVFDMLQQHANIPLLMRPLSLKAGMETPEDLDQLYIQRVVEILQKRYQPLTGEDILELLTN